MSQELGKPTQVTETKPSTSSSKSLSPEDSAEIEKLVEQINKEVDHVTLMAGDAKDAQYDWQLLDQLERANNLTF